MTSSSPATRIAIRCASTARACVEVGRRGGHLPADAVALHGLDDGVGRDLAGGRPGHQRGQLAAEVDLLLGEDLHAGRGGHLERVGAVGLVGDDPDALAVVAAAGGLEHDREAADGRGEGDRLRGVGDHRGAGGSARRGRRAGPASRPCPGRARGRPGPGRQACPSAVSVCRCSVGTCSWSKVTTEQPSATRAQRLEVAVVADQRVAHHLGGGDVGALGEQPERDAEGDGGLGHHPGELAAADDREHGRRHGGGRGHATSVTSAAAASGQEAVLAMRADHVGVHGRRRSRSAARGRGSW